jgi:hypothetical protein
MSRIVKRASAVSLTGGSGGTDDDYASRLAKYIPGEVVGAYLAVLKILETVKPDSPGAGALESVAWIVFFICLFIGVPGYLRLVAKPNEPWKQQALVSMGAFAVWAYALGGPFQLAKVYIPWLSSIILIVYTLLAGLVKPK